MAKEQAFKNSDTEYTKAFNASDPAKIAALYSEDAIIMMPEMTMFKGKKGVKAHAQMMLDAGWQTVEFKTILSKADGDLAVNIGSVALTKVSGGKATKLKGKYMDTYRRETDGSWKVIATMFNPDEPSKQST
jgi:uncharacterized protein (TIGR02246 family)